jgi:hydrogenase maturation factor
MESTNGYLLTCLYSSGCPELRELGAQEMIEGFVEGQPMDPAAMVKDVLRRIGPSVFYRLIAPAKGLGTDIFDREVVRAYWIYNPDLLVPVTKAAVTKILRQGFSGFSQHKQAEMITRIRGVQGGKPHHNFDVLWLLKSFTNPKVGIAIPQDLLQKTNDCLVRAGRVRSNGKALGVETVSVVQKGNNALALGPVSMTVGLGFVKKALPGDFVSIHLGVAREIISGRDAEDLGMITGEAIEFVNEGS